MASLASICRKACLLYRMITARGKGSSKANTIPPGKCCREVWLEDTLTIFKTSNLKVICRYCVQSKAQMYSLLTSWKGRGKEGNGWGGGEWGVGGSWRLQTHRWRFSLDAVLCSTKKTKKLKTGLKWVDLGDFDHSSTDSDSTKGNFCG